MKKEIRKSFFIGMFNGVVFTFAFLIFLVEMCDGPHPEEDLHAMDSLAMDTRISDLSMFDKDEIEKEYYLRFSTDHVLDIILHRYSMNGTIWEDKWDSLSDMEKVKLLLGDTINVVPVIKTKSRTKELKIAAIDSAESNNWDDSFTVIYRQRVNGYKVKTVARKTVSDVDIISADIVFAKYGESFTLHTSCFGDTLFSKGRLDYAFENPKIFRKYKNRTIYADYHKHFEEGGMMPMYTPFFFMDLDFDGVDELIIVHHSMALRYHDGYDIYRIVDGEPVLINYPPYKSNDDFGMTDYPEFDCKKKTIDCPYPEGTGGLGYIGRTIYGVSKKQKDTVVVNGKKHLFNHMEIIEEIKYD